MENVLELDHISYSFGEHRVLDDVSMTIHRGDYLGLVGGNGAGKSTLIRIILGLLPPSTGSVRMFGIPLAHFRAWCKIGYVPQKATSFDVRFPATVGEVVLMGRYGKRGLFRRMTAADRRAVDAALEHTGMSGYRERLIGDLSGGEQQRAFIARALAAEPEILFLDEPTVGVEVGVRSEFYTLLRKLNKEMHLTIILVTHDIESMAHEAMHIACIENGAAYYHDSVEGFLRETRAVIHQHDGHA